MAHRRLHDEIVLLNTKIEAYFALNEVGAHVWEMLDGRHDVAALVEQLLTVYNVDVTQLRQDVDELLADLDRNQLISGSTVESKSVRTRQT